MSHDRCVALPRVCLQFVVVVFPDHTLHVLRRATYKDIHVFEDIQRDCFVLIIALRPS